MLIKFGYALVQNIEGRIVPVNTLALDILRNYTRKTLSMEWMPISGSFLLRLIRLCGLRYHYQKFQRRVAMNCLRKQKANEDEYTTLLNLFPMDPATGQPRLYWNKIIILLSGKTGRTKYV